MMIGPKDKPGQYILKNSAGQVVQTFTNRAKMYAAYKALPDRNGFTLEQVA